MNKIVNILLWSITLFFFCGCDKYDDSRILKDLEDINNRITGLEETVNKLNSDLSALTELINSSFVSLISTNAEGNYVITYMDKGGESNTLVIATQNDVVTQPIISIAKDEDGLWYWQQTSDNGVSYEWVLIDGKKMPVGGDKPEVGIDKEGFWTVNGTPIKNSKGDKVLANDISNTLFKRAYVDEATGEAVFVMADDTELRMQLLEALSISFDKPVYNSINDYSSKLFIEYNVTGSHSEDVIVDIFTSYNIDAKVDPSIRTITVSMINGATEGNIIVMAHSNGNTVLKPLFFTYGSAEIKDPIYNGSTGIIQLEGEMTQFNVKVSSNIEYNVSVDLESSQWLIYNSTRSLTEKTHAFTADYFEDASGLPRTGTITFANELYDISASIVVRQSPKIPEGSNGGISTPADLIAFAAAVNAGASTSRWENESGEIILLNDIDMTNHTNWTPIGDINIDSYSSTEGYATINPFKGIFNGQGFAITNLNYSVEVNSDRFTYALFGAIQDATIKNLTLGSADKSIIWTFSGTSIKHTSVSSLVGYALNSTIEACTNYYNIDYVGEIGSGNLCIVSGLVGTIKNTTIGGRAKSLGSINRGFVRVGKITNTDNGGNGIQSAGVCGVMLKDAGNVVQYCVNYGHISCPTGRTGGLVATMYNGNIKNSDNRGLIEDDLAGKFEGTTAENAFNFKRMGGLVGGTDDLTKVPAATVESCTNYGNVMTHIGARTGGFIGHSNVQIIGCVNQGAILGEIYSEGHGPAWACGFSGASNDSWKNVSSSTMGGYVGSYKTYKDDPTSAPAATVDNAFAYANNRYDPSINN